MRQWGNTFPELFSPADLEKNAFLSFHTIQEIGDSKYLDVTIIPDEEQIAVSTHDIKAFPVNGAGYEFVVIGITADMYIGTYPDDVKSGKKFLKRNPCVYCRVLLLQAIK